MNFFERGTRSAHRPRLPPDIDGALHAEYCVIGVEDGAGLDGTSANNQTGSLGFPLDPRFDSLDFHGGPTRTLSLLPGDPMDPVNNPPSPALEKGSNPDNLLYDQRGVGYARVSNGAPDVGAFELHCHHQPPQRGIG